MREQQMQNNLSEEYRSPDHFLLRDFPYEISNSTTNLMYAHTRIVRVARFDIRGYEPTITKSTIVYVCRALPLVELYLS